MQRLLDATPDTLKEPVRLTARDMKLIKSAIPLQPVQTVVEDVVQQEEQLALQL